MKAHSVGLEIELGLSCEDMVELGNGKKLECLLNFRHPMSEKLRIIPLSLNYLQGENPQVEVNQFPLDVYFGSAEKIEISIQDPFYVQLIKDGYCSDRFGLGGRVDISKFA
jgi:hypothetical protein